MSFCTSSRSWPHRFGVVLQSFLQHPGLPFADVLPEERIEAAFAEEGVAFAKEPGAIYTPAVTLWAFLSQVLYKDEHRSCAAAVARVTTLMAAFGRPDLSDNTGAYCRARAKLPEGVIRHVTYAVADESERAIPHSWLWRGRRVKLVDGTTVSMPDTKANQAEFPQHTAQEEGLGFPIARALVLMSLATAMVCGMACGPYSGKETGETALLRELLDRLDPGDVLLADRYFCSYFMIALLLARKVDVVVRMHQLRKTDFRRGERLGKGDHVVEWSRPARPQWMDQETYDQIPEVISVREVHVRVVQPGFRVQSLVVVTTLLDHELYTLEDIAELYHKRWLAELDIRDIKVTLGMDILRCKSPEMVRREIWSCLLAYNLIRQTMLNAASQGRLSPRQLSFSAALQKIAASFEVMVVLDEAIVQIADMHVRHLSQQIVGDRPDRVEPRAIKRRPKPHKLLKTPRALARAELLAGHSL